MKQSHAVAYLRQLCCSGLSKEVVIQEFLRAVKTVIPSDNNVFSGCDEQFNPNFHLLEFVNDTVDDTSPVVIARYFTPERRQRSAEMFRNRPVVTDATLWDELFYRNDLYNLVNRRYDQHHVLWALVRENGKPVGMMSLYRPRQQKPFGSREQALALRLLPYVAHALRAPGDKGVHYSVNGTSGMMVLNAQGSILYLSDEAKRLLALASHPIMTLNARRQKEALLAKLAQLCRNYAAIFRGQSAAPPSCCHTGPHGRFMFHAYWLDRQNREPGGLIGMTVEHQEPLTLKILRAMQALPLSPMQKEVALLLAQGVSSEMIGQRLHIKPTTVKDHIGKIFTKLDIHRREELLPRLLALDNSMSIVKVW